MRSICTTKKKGGQCKFNGNGATNLVRTISSISFTQLATFGRRHHSPPYSILCASLRGRHPNVTFPWDSQVGVPKLRLLLSQNFGHSYIFEIKFVLRMRNKYFIAFKKDLSKGVQHALIGPHLTLAFKGFVVGSQIPNLTLAFSFDHNSCKSGLNEQCEGTLSIYFSRPF